MGGEGRTITQVSPSRIGPKSTPQGARSWGFLQQLSGTCPAVRFFFLGGMSRALVSITWMLPPSPVFWGFKGRLGGGGGSRVLVMFRPADLLPLILGVQGVGPAVGAWLWGVERVSLTSPPSPSTLGVQGLAGGGVWPLGVSGTLVNLRSTDFAPPSALWGFRVGGHVCSPSWFQTQSPPPP